MPIPIAKYAQKKAKLRCKQEGTVIQLSWTEWPNGEPDEDPTTGAKIETEEYTSVRRTANIRAFVHIHEPVTTSYKAFAEIAAGDAIVDLPFSLIRITDAGDTSLTVGQIVDELTFSQANRAVEDSALGTDVEPADLENPSMVFAGTTWVQKRIGDQLAKNWDAIYAGLNINRCFLMTKA
jgi:hypothetical protein